ncbi:MAG: serine hydrolase [Oscillospiraceae bacterium]
MDETGRHHETGSGHRGGLRQYRRDGRSEDGETVYERYFGGCTAESRLNVFSVTKSIVSILLGIALDRGCLGSIDQQVLEFFPEYTPKRGEKTIQNITIRDMLTMTAPYKYRSTPYTKYFTSPDWVRFSLDLLGGEEPVGEFRYAPLIGPDILTGILTRVTGQSVLDFAKERLFAPLGIPVEQSITFRSREELMAFYESTDLRVWAADPMGVNAGSWGLTLSPMDLAKLGQLYLRRRRLERAAARIGTLGAGERRRAEPVGRARSALRISVVGPPAGARLCGHGRRRQRPLCQPG